MTKRTFNIILVVITIISLLVAILLTSSSVTISKNKATNRAKEDLLGSWTDISNPQIVIQFTPEDEFKISGQTHANYTVDINNNIITLDYLPEFNSMREYYNYSIDPVTNQLTLINVDTNAPVVYSR